jgi:hypothetical protein
MGKIKSMKTLTINTKSWHYRYINWAIDVPNSWEMDTCRYVRLFILATLKIIFFTAFAVTALATVIMGCFNIGFIITGANVFVSILVGAVAVAIPLAVIISSIVGISAYFTYRKEKRLELQEAIKLENWERQARGEKPVEVERGAVSTLYQGFKEKTCAKVKFDYGSDSE